ncbi:MAG: pilus assembly protein PilP [Deltaproteobacteria bacterium]|nr:pilus assembly protein PilP [Deltaproteobacteria bacterium]
MAHRRKRKKSPALGLLSLLLIIASIAAMGYYKFRAKPLDARQVVEEVVQAAKASKKLSPTEEALLRVQIAVTDFAARNSTPPNSLFDLVPAYFDKVPDNPETKKPFIYERNGADYMLRASDEPVQLALTSEDGEGQEQQTASIVANDATSAAAQGMDDFVNPNTLEEEDFVYDPSKLRDPFVPFDFSPKANADESLTPLERYSLDQLRLTAVISDSQGRLSAIVEDSTGRGYTVGNSTKIGDSGGVIVSVEKDHLKILQTKVDFTGNETQEVIEMKIATSTGSDEKDKSKQNARRGNAARRAK